MISFAFAVGAWAPGPALLAGLAAGGVVLVSLGLALVAYAGEEGRFRWPALLLGLAGIVFTDYALDQVRTQMKAFQISPTESRMIPRYPTELRDWTIPGMAALPVLFAAGVIFLWTRRVRMLHEEVPEHYREGVHHYYQKNYEAALIELTAGLKIEPHRADILCMRGAVFARLGAYEMALADLDHALARAPGMPEAHLHRGRVRVARAELELALADFDQVLNARHNDSECLLERGICLERMGRTPEAVATYDKILRLTNHPDLAFPAAERLRTLGASVPAWPSATPSPSTS